MSDYTQEMSSQIKQWLVYNDCPAAIEYITHLEAELSTAQKDNAVLESAVENQAGELRTAREDVKRLDKLERFSDDTWDEFTWQMANPKRQPVREIIDKLEEPNE